MGDFDGLNLTAADLCGISMDALKLIVVEEDSSEAFYVRHFTHFDFPGGASGPTVGIGCDCGYMSVADIRTNWAGIVDESTITALTAAAGLRGGAAHAFVQAHGTSVTITWAQAIQEFCRRELPEWVKNVEDEIPGFDKLPPDCKGAIVSLAYNRGASFKAPGSRYTEMRAIRADVMNGDWADIPGQFLDMRRLWPPGTADHADLTDRRAHEATLFIQGLDSIKNAIPPVETAPSPPAPPAEAPPETEQAPPATETAEEPQAAVEPPQTQEEAPHEDRDVMWVQKWFNVRNYTTPPLALDGILGNDTKQTVEAYQHANGLTVDGIPGPKTTAHMAAQS
jgi:GH24 family phage-related lysozyme (muramidase)